MHIFVRFRMASISKITIAFLFIPLPYLTGGSNGCTFLFIFEAEALVKLPLLPTFETETLRSRIQALPT